jgi:hypothetical protein
MRQLQPLVWRHMQWEWLAILTANVEQTGHEAGPRVSEFRSKCILPEEAENRSAQYLQVKPQRPVLYII